jgi:hypothetical protein
VIPDDLDGTPRCGLHAKQQIRSGGFKLDNPSNDCSLTQRSFDRAPVSLFLPILRKREYQSQRDRLTAVCLVAQLVLLVALANCSGYVSSKTVQPTVSLNLSVSPTALNLGNVIFNHSSPVQTILVSNNSSGSITVSGITVSGPFASAGNTLPMTLNTGQSMTLNVTFKPTASGAASGNLTIASTAGNSPSVVSLAGTGVSSSGPLDLTISQTSLSFGTATVNHSSPVQTILVSNNSGGSISVNGIAVSGPFASAGNTLPKTLNTGQSMTLDVTFTPTASGAASGSLTITSTAGNSPWVVSLTGTGVSPSGPLDLTFLPTSLSFGTVVVSDSSPAQTIVVSNGSSGSITVNAIAVSVPFALAGDTLPKTLNTGQSMTLDVTFTPTASGAASGSLTISSTAGNSPSVVTLRGTGASSVPVGTRVPNAFFGVSLFRFSSDYPPSGGMVLGTFGKAGDIAGFYLEPTCDGGLNQSSTCYTWANLDDWVDFAAARGLNLVYDFEVPGWMCGADPASSCQTLPSNLTYVTNFAQTLATRYAGKIKYYETGNEMNDPVSTGGWAGSCAELVLLSNTIYTAIKAGDPNAIVGVPSLSYGGGTKCMNSPNSGGGAGQEWVFLENFLQTRDANGHLPMADTVGEHLYQRSEPSLRTDAGAILTVYNNLRSVTTAAGISQSAPLLVTEGGFGADSNSQCSAPLNATACLSNTDQVAYIGRWLVLGASTWSDGGGMLPNWYAYDLSLGTLNGTFGMNPQNASAYGQMESWLSGASFNQQCQVGAPSTVLVCAFTNASGKPTEIIFNNNAGATATYSTPSWATTHQQLLGSQASITGGAVTVGNTPILLQ